MNAIKPMAYILCRSDVITYALSVSYRIHLEAISAGRYVAKILSIVCSSSSVKFKLSRTPRPSSICSGRLAPQSAGVCGDAVQVFISEHAAVEDGEGDAADAFLLQCVEEAIVFGLSGKQIVFGLMDQTGRT